MLLSAVSVLVVAQSSSEIPEGLMNNPVHTAYLEVLILCLEKPIIYPSLLVQTCPILSLIQTILFTINRTSAEASFTRVWRWMYFRESVNRR